MSRSLKTIGIFAAILLAAVAVRNLTGTADEKGEPSDAAGRTRAGESHDSPRARSRPRGADVPLAHALIKKEEPSAEDKIVAALEKPTNVEWQELALEDCLTYLQEFHQIPVWLDKHALSEEGIALDQPITMKLMGARLDSILNLLLGPPQLEWVIQDEVLKITTREWCKNNPEVQAHEIQMLVDAGHTPEELIASIKACIEPESWSPKDGYAGISHSGGVLIVRQTQRIHTEINKLLVELDEIAEREADAHRDHDKGAVVSVKVYQTGEQPAEKVAEAVQDFVELGSWKKRGGDGEVKTLKGSIVVKQTARVHRAIQRFLAQIDSAPPQVAAATATQTSAAPAASTIPPDPFRVLNPPAAPGGSNPLRRKRNQQPTY